MRRRPNGQVRLKSEAVRRSRAEHLEIVEAPVPAISDGQVLVRNIYLSVDPAMRGWVSAVASSSEPVALGAVMRSLAVGRVEESRNSDFDPGEHVTGMFGWQDYAAVDAKAIERKVGGSGLPISTSLGVLGVNGLTAYFALLDIGQPKAGETVVVSTAAGAVGHAPVKSPRSRGAVPQHRRWARQSAYMPRGVPLRLCGGLSKLTILSRRSMLPALRASMSTLTTRPAQSAIPSCDVRGWCTGGDLRHGVHRELGPAT